MLPSSSRSPHLGRYPVECDLPLRHEFVSANHDRVACSWSLSAIALILPSLTSCWPRIMWLPNVVAVATGVDLIPQRHVLESL
ncbi:hypothetical protein N657DRAFT_650553 [Parathielavia appendiculata]|uniref:Uncharacterized protein n=1 Tax=Parathielavia appendiculata TaxID=2587402 RepID=A0AAN6TR64_9PEZI|nr:hypothetical protein N657DRAFT_650553 [Parathielavia appendiculata]